MILRELTTLLNYKNDLSGLAVAQQKINAFVGRTQAVGVRLSAIMSAPIVALGTTSVMAAMKIDKMRVSFDILTGSVEAGSKFLQEIMDYALKNPIFDEEMVGNAAQLMMKFGFAAKDVIPTIARLSDVVAGSGISLERMGYALGLAKTMGHVTSRSLLQLVRGGVPIYEYLSRAIFGSKGHEAETMKMVAKGKVTIENLMKAFDLMSQKGERYFGATEKKGRSLEGQFFRLGKVINDFQQELGAAIIKDLHLADTLGFLSKIIEHATAWFKSLNPNVLRFSLILVGLAATIPPLILGFSVLLGTISLLAPEFMAMLAPLLLAVGVFALLVEDFLVWKKGGKSLLGDMFGSFDVFFTNMKAAFRKVMADIRKAWKGDWTDLINDTSGFLVELLNKISSSLIFGKKGGAAYRAAQNVENPVSDPREKGFVADIANEIWRIVQGVKAMEPMKGSLLNPSLGINPNIRSAMPQPVMRDVVVQVQLGAGMERYSADTLGTILANKTADAIKNLLRPTAAHFEGATP